MSGALAVKFRCPGPSKRRPFPEWADYTPNSIWIYDTAVEARHADGLVDVGVDDEARPILLAVSDNGPQMRSGSTREFLALCAIAQHFGRPGTPTDQAWIESLNGHLKHEFPHLLVIEDPATLRAELAIARRHYNTVRLHAGIGYVTPTTNTKAVEKPSANSERQASNKPGSAGLPSTEKNARIPTSRNPAMLSDSTPISIAN